MKLLNVGFGNMVSTARLVAIVSPDSSPIRRLVADARDENRVIDATCGRKTRAVLIMDSGHVVLSPLLPETAAARMDGKALQDEMEDEDE